MHGQIHHVEIYVSHIENSISFWSWLLCEKLHYQIYQQWPKGISYKLGNTYIVFVQTEQKHLINGYHRKNTGLNHLAFHAKDRQFIDELRVACIQKNITLLYEEKYPYAGGKNYYAIFMEDPDRIKVEVVSLE